MKVDKNRGQVVGGTIMVNLPGFPRPKFADSLKFPNDVTQLTGQNVSELLGKYTQLLTYVSEQHTFATVSVLDLETRIVSLANRIVVEDPKLSHIEKWRRDQIVDSDPRIFNLRVKLLEAKKHKEVAYMYISNYDRYISALSRELSRKLATNDGAFKGKAYA